MPFRSGALSVSRFQVVEDIPETLPKTATVALRRYLWRPIDDARGERESFGWVNPRRLLAETFTWEDVVDGPYVLLGVRRDRKNFSQVLFRARRDELFDRTKSERNITRLSRQQRLALEEQLTVEMLRETSPQSTFAEVVWDTNSNLLLVGTTANTFCERTIEIFEATFDLKVRPLFPALIGADAIAAQGLEEEFRLAGAGGGGGPAVASGGGEEQGDGQ